MFVLLALLCAQGAIGQAASSRSDGSIPIAELVEPGVVVEKVDKAGAAAKAGIHEGDLLLHWSQGNATGDFDRLFGLETLQKEEGRAGAVKLTGLRSGQEATWNMSDTDLAWGIHVRPNLPEALLPLHLQGRQLVDDHKPMEAAERWREAAASAEKLQPGSGWLASWLLVQAGDTLVAAQKPQEAAAVYQEAIQKLEPGSLAQARAFHHTGIAWSRVALDNAGDYLGRALAIVEKLTPGSLSVADHLYDLGVVASSRGELVEGEAYFERALAIWEKLLPGSLLQANGLKATGLLLQELGDLDKAEDNLKRSLAIAEKVSPNGLSVAYSLNNLALVASDRGDLAKTEEYFRRALVIKEQVMPGSPTVASGLNNLGQVAASRGDFAEADRFYNRALAIWEKVLPDGPGIAVALNNLGETDHSRGDLSKAEEHYRRAMAIFEKLAPGDLMVGAGLSNLASIEQDRGDLGKAEDYFSRALAIEEKAAPGTLAVADTLSKLGSLAYDHGDLGKAEEYQRRALAIQEKFSPGSPGHADVLAWLARIALRKKQNSEAAQLYAHALNALENQTSHLGGSEESRSAFRGQHLSLYGEYAGLLLNEHQSESAFQVVERSRARGLLETLAAAHIDIRKGVDSVLLAQEKLLQSEIGAKSKRRAQLLSDAKDVANADQQLAVVNNEIALLVSQLGGIEGRIRASSPSYTALTQPQPLSTAEIQKQLLDPETLLLEYLLGEERSYVFAVTPDSLDVFELPRRAEIDKAARRLYSLLTARNRGVRGETMLQQRQRTAGAEAAYTKASADLSRMILGPVAGQLRNKRLLIVADGALQYVPFAALPEPESQRADQSKQTPLAVGHEIVNLPSASVLAVLRQEEQGRSPAPKAVAVLADPVFDRHDTRVTLHNIPQTQSNAGTSRANRTEIDDLLSPPTSAGLLTRSAGDLGLSSSGQLSFPRLRFSRLEADAIMNVTPAGSGMKAVDFAANRATATSAELGQYRIVHFATHGLLNSEHPELSGLVLSLVDKDGKPQEGFLQLQDIYNLNLPADLVVLSACETGLGKEINGEGLIGLTRGFMYAGASRVVASLWKVSDAATAKLMADFYKAMERDGLPPAAALRSAQIQMWKQKRWSSPYYWAAFQIQGEWK